MEHCLHLNVAKGQHIMYNAKQGSHTSLTKILTDCSLYLPLITNAFALKEI